MYFGSVKFFKNMILLVVVVCIAVPAIASISLCVSLNRQKETSARLQAESERLEATLSNTERQLQAVQQQLDELTAQQQARKAEAPRGAEPPEAIYYQGLYPDFYAPEEYHATERVPGTIFLTFDGGPSANTRRILDVLSEKQVKATFFVSGQDEDAGLQILRDIADEGHTIGMHSFSRDYSKIYSSVEAFLDDMYLIFSQIKEATGEAPTVFRFPGGSINSYNAGIYQELLAEMLRRGFVPCDWNLSAEDSAGGYLSAEQIVQNVMGSMDRIERGFVQMHDGESQDATVEALSQLIDELRELDYNFDRLTPETKPVLFVYKD